MDEQANQDQVLRTTARILIWCFILSMALLTVWFLAVVLASDLIYRVHGFFFADLSREHFALAHYLSMAVLKVGAFIFFLGPYIAIRIVQRKKEKSEGA